MDQGTDRVVRVCSHTAWRTAWHDMPERLAQAVGLWDISEVSLAQNGWRFTTLLLASSATIARDVAVETIALCRLDSVDPRLCVPPWRELQELMVLLAARTVNMTEPRFAPRAVRATVTPRFVDAGEISPARSDDMGGIMLPAFNESRIRVPPPPSRRATYHSATQRLRAALPSASTWPPVCPPDFEPFVSPTVARLVMLGLLPPQAALKPRYTALRQALALNAASPQLPAVAPDDPSEIELGVRRLALPLRKTYCDVRRWPAGLQRLAAFWLAYTELDP
jgi:hypothetical protein